MPLTRLAPILAAALVLALMPCAARAAQPPRGAWVLTVHGGGWHEVGPGPTARMDADVARLHRWGYGTVNVDYRAGPLAFGDVLRAYDRLRSRVGRRTPICAMGASAGGQLVLMLAVHRPEVACVITHAAPTLLSSLGPKLQSEARWAFGAHGLARWSPALYALRTPLLIEQAAHDRLVPFDNSLRMHAADPRSRVIRLSPGSVPWTHASVDAREVAVARESERRFLARWTERRRPGNVLAPPRSTTATGTSSRTRSTTSSSTIRT